MQKSLDFGYLTMITGPMFSGKTWQLITEVMKYHDLNYKCCIINHSIDVRETSGKTGSLTYHIGCNVTLPSDITMISCSSLEGLDVSSYTCIAVDEAQFFPSLESCVRWLDSGKHMVISCLNGCSERKMMGDVGRIIPHCNDIKLRRSYCGNCRLTRGTLEDAIYTKCIVKKDDQICIGGSDKYTPVCRKCYDKM